MKKVLTVVLVLLAAVPLAVWGISRADVSAAETTWNWDFNETTHTLTISGTGDMKDFNSPGAPWYNIRNQISKVVIEHGITSIGKNAFRDSTVKFVTISNTVTKIGEYAFCDCTNLYEVVMSDSITTVGDSAFKNCSKMEYLTLSNNLTDIYNHAFQNCKSLKEITLPNSLININDEAFRNCTGLTHITIPGSVKFVGECAFDDCAVTVTFNEGLETIGKYAFSNILNDMLIIPDSVTTIGDLAFDECYNITKIITGTNLTKIGNSAFKGIKKLMSVDFSRSQNLQVIDSYAFKQTGITSAIIPDSVTTIGSEAFCDCKHLSELKLPSNITKVSYQSFAYAAIESVYIPENVLSIDREAFRSCNNLKKIVIPHNVTNIYDEAFYDCKSLIAIDISGDGLTLNGSPFYGLSKIITHVHIPAQLRPSYFAGKYGLPVDGSCYFQIGDDGMCSDPDCPFGKSSGVSGDINNDGKLNNTDIILLGRSYMAGDSAKYIAVADMNNDGKINNTDIILLGRLYMSMQ